MRRNTAVTQQWLQVSVQCPLDVRFLMALTHLRTPVGHTTSMPSTSYVTPVEQTLLSMIAFITAVRHTLFRLDVLAAFVRHVFRSLSFRNSRWHMLFLLIFSELPLSRFCLSLVSSHSSRRSFASSLRLPSRPPVEYSLPSYVWLHSLTPVERTSLPVDCFKIPYWIFAFPFDTIHYSR